MRALPFFMLLSRTAGRPVSPMRELHQLTASFHPDQLSSPFHSCARCIYARLLYTGKADAPRSTPARDASIKEDKSNGTTDPPRSTPARDASDSVIWP